MTRTWRETLLHENSEKVTHTIKTNLRATHAMKADLETAHAKKAGSNGDKRQEDYLEGDRCHRN